LLGIAWTGCVYWLNPSFVWWLLPVAGALMISIPLSVYTSRVAAGRSLRESGLFLIPEEHEVPPEISRMQQIAEDGSVPPGFADAIVDPVVNAMACASGIARFNQPEHVRAERLRLVDAAVSQGPDVLTPQQKMILLGDPLALSRLHFQTWIKKNIPERWRVDAQQDSGLTSSALPQPAPVIH
jgi:membrane glycosyltransferase